MEGLETIMRGLLRLYPDLNDDKRSRSKPLGSVAVKRVLKDRPRHWFSVPEMVAELESRGWLPASSSPENATRTALERAVTHYSDRYEKSQRIAAGGKSQVVYRVKGG
jgi:hypothetical protein